MGKKTFVSPFEKDLKEKLAYYTKLKDQLDALATEVKEARTVSAPLLKKLGKLTEKAYALLDDVDELIDKLNEVTDGLEDVDDVKGVLEEVAENLQYVQKQLSS